MESCLGQEGGDLALFSFSLQGWLLCPGGRECLGAGIERQVYRTLGASKR